MSFGENLQFIRKERNITQEQLAEKLDVSRQAVSKWESGNGYPETEKLIAISRELNISIDYLLDEKSNTEENRTAVYAPTGKIAITSFDNSAVVNCQAVKVSKVLGSGKGIEYVLYGVEGFNFWGEKTTLLAWYRTLEEIQAEVKEISEAIAQGKTSYKLYHFAPVEYKGIFGQPHIIE